jgi:hypothetical protein
LGHADQGDDDADLQREAGMHLLGEWFVLTGLIFNRLDVLHKEWRAVHGLK